MRCAAILGRATSNRTRNTARLTTPAVMTYLGAVGDENAGDPTPQASVTGRDSRARRLHPQSPCRAILPTKMNPPPGIVAVTKPALEVSSTRR